MEIIGYIVLTILFLWLLFHREKEQDTYHTSVAKSVGLLPDLARFYLGVR